MTATSSCSFLFVLAFLISCAVGPVLMYAGRCVALMESPIQTDVSWYVAFGISIIYWHFFQLIRLY